MVWAIASSIFVIYLYRSLNAADDVATATDGPLTASTIDAELARLDARIDAIETVVSGTARSAKS